MIFSSLILVWSVMIEVEGGKNKWKGYIVLIYSIDIVDQINEMKIDLKKEKEKGNNEEWRMKLK